MTELHHYFIYKNGLQEYYVRSIRDGNKKEDMLYHHYIKTIYQDWLYKNEESVTGKWYKWKVEYKTTYRIPKNLMLENKYKYTFTCGSVNDHTTMEIYDIHDKRCLTVNDLWFILKNIKSRWRDDKERKFYVEFMVYDFQDIFINIPEFLESNMVKDMTSPYNVFFDGKALIYSILLIMYRNSYLKKRFNEMFNSRHYL